MAKLLLLLFLLLAPQIARACDAPLGSIMGALSLGWPNLAFHYENDEANFIVRAYFKADDEVDNVYALEGDDGRPILFVASKEGCVVGRAQLTKDSVAEITSTMDEYRRQKQLRHWRSNL